MIHSFRDLLVWQKGLDLVVKVYQATGQLPPSELYGLTSQMRRSSVSMPSNVAEGKALGGRSYPKHIKIALGSEAELQTQIEVTRRLKMLSDAEAHALAEQTSEVGRMLAGLYGSLT